MVIYSKVTIPLILYFRKLAMVIYSKVTISLIFYFNKSAMIIHSKTCFKIWKEGSPVSSEINLNIPLLMCN